MPAPNRPAAASRRWSDWPVISRQVGERVADLLGEAAQGGRPAGVALLGSEGVGKTTVAGHAATRLGRGGPLWVVGTATRSSVPFGAFASLMDLDAVGRPAELIRSAADSILAQADSAPIIVDNARLLDPLSASLVYRLAQQATVPLIVTVRTVLRVPQVVAALWQDGLLLRVDVDPLDGAETAELVDAAGGGDPGTLYRRSAGNPLHLRLLMATGGAEETLAAAIDRYLVGLDPQAREVLSHLCVYEPLSRADLTALTGDAAVEAAAGAGTVQFYGDMAYSGHPLYLERLAVRLDREQVQRLRGAVAEQLARRPTRTVSDRLGRVLLTLQSEGSVEPGSVVAASRESLRLGALGLAERLARGALERAEDLDARLSLSHALAWQGRGQESDAVLAAVDEATLSEDQMMAWALPRAANQFWMLSEPERATVFLQTVRARVQDASARSTLDALLATFAMNAGNVRRAVEVAEDVLARPDAPETAVAWAASAAALSCARMGRLAEVGPLRERALGAEHPGLLRFTVGLAETTSLVMAGRTDAALETARAFTDFAESAQPGRAIGDVLLARVLLARGDAGAAAALLAPAAATLDRTGYSWGPLALMLLTTALAHQGEIAESAKALARAQSRHGTKSAIFAPELGIARAWRLATIGDRPAAITAARDAARMAERAGQYAVAVQAWHEAARLGDRRAAAGLAQVAAHADCAYTSMASAHARALAAGDRSGLAAAAAELAAAGFAGAAADATRQAEAAD